MRGGRCGGGGVGDDESLSLNYACKLASRRVKEL